MVLSHLWARLADHAGRANPTAARQSGSLITRKAACRFDQISSDGEVTEEELDRLALPLSAYCRKRYVSQRWRNGKRLEKHAASPNARIDVRG